MGFALYGAIMKRPCNAVGVFVFSLLFFVKFQAFSFSKSDIISPKSGNFHNLQALVLRNQDDDDIYYSLTGSDPLVSGFSYDGPVVIDGGKNVKLKIAAISRATGEKNYFDVEYNVLDYAESYSGMTSSFIHEIQQNPIRVYSCGSEFFMPEGFWVNFGEKFNTFPSKSISLSEKNIQDYYVPVTFFSDLVNLSFVIHVVPVALPEKKKDDLPFEVTDWNNVYFASPKYIYNLDGEDEWVPSGKRITLDGNSLHTVSFQDVEFNVGNEIHTYTIFPKPDVFETKNEDGSISYTIDEFNDYCVDCFENMELSGIAEIPYVKNGVFSGNLKKEFRLDKNAPLAPSIMSSSNSIKSRDTVILSFSSSDPGDMIFVHVSDPIVSEDGFSLDDDRTPPVAELKDFDYLKSSHLLFSCIENKATMYDVTAFCMDCSGNKSDFAYSTVVVDKYNYYLSEKNFSQSASANPDGSYSNPFKTFEQASCAISKTEGARLHVSGTIHVSSKCVISSDCMILGNGCTFVFDDDASLCVSNAKVGIFDCIFEKHAKNDSSGLLKFVDANATLSGCEVVGIFEKDGILIDSEKSHVSFVDSGLTCSASSYALCGTFASSDSSFLNTRLTSSASTCVNLSMCKSSCDVRKCSFSVIGDMVRTVELIASNADFFENSFDVKEKKSISHANDVWFDADSVVDFNAAHKKSCP